MKKPTFFKRTKPIFRKYAKYATCPLGLALATTFLCPLRAKPAFSGVQAQVGFGMFLSTPESAQSIANALLNGNAQGVGVNQILQDLGTLGQNFQAVSHTLSAAHSALSGLNLGSAPQIPNSLNGSDPTGSYNLENLSNAVSDYPQALQGLQSALKHALTSADKTPNPQNALQQIQQTLSDASSALQSAQKTYSTPATSQSLGQAYNNIQQQVTALTHLYSTKGAFTNVSTIESVAKTLNALDNIATTAQKDAQTLHLSPQAQQDLAKALGGLNSLKSVTGNIWGTTNAGSVSTALSDTNKVATSLQQAQQAYNSAATALGNATNRATQANSQVKLLEQMSGIVADLKDLQGLEGEAKSAANQSQQGNVDQFLQNIQKTYSPLNKTLQGLSQQLTDVYNDLSKPNITPQDLKEDVKTLDTIFNNMATYHEVLNDLQKLSNQLTKDKVEFTPPSAGVIKQLDKANQPLANIQKILEGMQTAQKNAQLPWSNSVASGAAKNLAQSGESIQTVQDALNTIQGIAKQANTGEQNINTLVDQTYTSYNTLVKDLQGIQKITRLLGSGVVPINASNVAGLQGMLQRQLQPTQQQVTQAYKDAQATDQAITLKNLPSTISNALNTNPKLGDIGKAIVALESYIQALTGQDIAQALPQSNNSLVQAAANDYGAAVNALQQATQAYNNISTSNALSSTAAGQQELAKALQIIKEVDQALTNYQKALTNVANTKPAQTSPQTQPNNPKTHASNPSPSKPDTSGTTHTSQPKDTKSAPNTQPHTDKTASQDNHPQTHNLQNPHTQSSPDTKPSLSPDKPKVAQQQPNSKDHPVTQTPQPHIDKTANPLDHNTHQQPKIASQDKPNSPHTAQSPAPANNPLQILSNTTDSTNQRENAWEIYVKTQNQIMESIQAELESQAKQQGMDLAQTLVNLMAGMQQSVGQNLDQKSYISAALIEHYDHFYNAVLDNSSISFYVVQESLNNLITEVASARQNLFNQLNPETPLVGALPPQAAVLLAKIDLPQLNLAVDAFPVAQSIGAAIKELNILLAYLNATKADLKQYLSANHQPTATTPRFLTQNLTQSQNGNMYGVDMQVGYKQFFGKKKRWGLRYYGTFSYQHGTFYMSDSEAVDNFVYGAGADALYNFYESKDGKYTSGVFAGLMLTGSTWLAKGASNYIAYMASLNAHGGHAVMHTTYFQIPLNIGFRSNVSKHHGFEIGLRIPLAADYYFKGTNANGDDLDITYKRNISVFFNYVYSF
ncbi:outer membrane beta-barrel protein [Helicobacter ailurogastricus]|uniref:outer membrane beta-barrel protein n=1 Tax=Helicobacter ailurogastricus TaxID=1578720 RepID=UPI001F2094B0|nr:outer membrane beta-barrel protein [Helicobacter ailurogastricus]